MIINENASIQELWMHHIGNASNGDTNIWSSENIDLSDEGLEELLKSYFLNNFQEPAFYAFTFYDGNTDLNPMYHYAKCIFQDPELLGEHSVHIGKFLYENSKHPNIKSGDLLVTYLTDIVVDDEVVDAIGIFKSENKQPFITIEQMNRNVALHRNSGIHPGKLDKACLILNTENETGYKICALDLSNRSKDAQFWIEKFLNVTERSDDYHHTQNYIKATKAFVTDRLKPMYEIDKPEEAEILNHSLAYLKNADRMNQVEFDEAVFKSPEVINDFQLYKLEFQQENGIELADDFTVHPSAVKKQSKVFKSVLKLDKNFHIYIHGNRKMIEKGEESDGRKFYKIYYTEEN